MRFIFSLSVPFLFLILLALEGRGQILDDTTRTIYDPRTTRVRFEQDVMQGKYEGSMIDTTLTNSHRERFWYPDTTFHQDLANLGTASTPLLFRFPERIGIRLGRNAFDRYATDPRQFKYYDTRSPYSHLHYIQGANGQQKFDAKYSRNITPSWNFGFEYNRLTATKQIANLTRRDGLVDRLGLTAFSSFQNQDSSYQLFFNVMHHNHQQIETGGVRVQAGTPLDTIFNLTEIFPNLTQAANREVRNTWHLGQYYRLGGEHLKIFHVLDSRLQRNYFTDEQLPREGQNLLYYPEARLDSARTFDLTRYLEVENQVGVTGNSNIYFYRLFLKRRDVRYFNSALDATRVMPTANDNTRHINRKFGQNFAGLETRLNMPGNGFVQVAGEFQFPGDYRARAEFGWPFISLSRSMISYTPSLVEQRYVSNHFQWNNNFNKPLAEQTTLQVKGNFLRQAWKIDLGYNRLTNYIYFNEAAEPAQETATLALFTASLQHHYRYRKFHFNHYVVYTNTDRAPVIRVPELVINSKIYYEGSIFKNALFGQIGIDTYYNTAYYAYGYMPVTQQFHIQNQWQANAYPIVDVFLTADIKAVNLFVRMQHANQDFLLGPGYLVTPNYLGMNRTFLFGAIWRFFD